MAHMGRSEKSFVEPVFSVHLYVVSVMEPRLSSLCSSFLYLLSHLTRPFLLLFCFIFIYLCGAMHATVTAWG